MKRKKQTLHRVLFRLAGLILLSGLLIATLLFKQAHSNRYPNLIPDAYRERQHQLTVPGTKQVHLSRTGAYGIYFEHKLVSPIYPEVEIPPAIDCTLTSKTTGAMIEAVPDYVKTNRYRLKDHHSGVLTMSLSVDKPGSYTFACVYQDGSTGPEIQVALGPNYFWEFLQVAGKIGLPFVGGISVFCGSLLLALPLLVIGIAIKSLSAPKSDSKTHLSSENWR